MLGLVRGPAHRAGRLPPDGLRRRLKYRLVETGHRYAVAGLVLLLLALVGGVDLAASILIGPWASLLAAVLAGVFVTFWFLLPLRHRSAGLD